MKTTFLNPVLWLLAATAGNGCRRCGARPDGEGRSGTYSEIGVFLAHPHCARADVSCRIGLAGGNRSRAERDMNGGQAAAVRRLLIQTPADAVETRSAFRDWIWPSERPSVPWETTAGSAPCPVKTMATQVPLFTIQADTPMLLVAAAPIVGAAGAARADGWRCLCSPWPRSPPLAPFS